MRKKEKKLVVAFTSTTAAIALETKCRESGVPGQLIPIPPVITAGCGLAWCAPPEAQDKVLSAVQASGISIDSVYELML